MFSTFKSKINIYYFTLFVLVFAAVAVSVQIYLKRSLENNLKTQMKHYTNMFEKLTDYLPSDSSRSEKLKQIAHTLNLRLTIIQFDGNVLFDSDVDNPAGLDNHSYRDEIVEAQTHIYGARIRFSHTLNVDMFYVAKKSSNRYIRVAMTANDVNNVISGAIQFIYLTAGIFLVILTGINFLLASYLSQPVREIVNFTKHFKQGDYSVRLPVYKLDELGLVKLSLNYMAKSVAKNVDSISMQKLRLEKVVKSVSEGMLLLEEEGKVFLYNQGFFDILEIKTREMEGIFYYEAITNSRIINLVDEAMDTNEKKRDHFTITRSGSFETKTINVNCIPLENKKGCIILFEDVTEEFNLTKLKREFISNASHEFKTPLAIIKGYIETLLSGVESEEKKTDFLEKIHLNIVRLNNIVNDVITLNKIEDYKDIFTFTKTNVVRIIDNCLEILSPLAKKSDIQIITELDEKIKINTSPELFEIIIYNLIDNAIKYNEKQGYVKITSKVKKDSVYFKITDSGIGIPKEHLDKIFERFFTSNGGRSRAKGGTGLGLSIVKHAISILKGEISVLENPEGKGSMFLIKIPMNVKRS